jgi:hypothetical protein
MSVTTFNTGGEIQIHRTGCQDIKRGENKFWSRQSEIFETVKEAYDNYLDTPEEPGFVEEEIRIHNCTK